MRKREVSEVFRAFTLTLGFTMLRNDTWLCNL